MSGIEEIQTILDKLKEAKYCIIEPGVLDADTDLQLPDGRTIGESLPGGIRSLVGRYNVDCSGLVRKAE